MDKSGNGNNATQPTAASQAILGQGASGEYYLTLDGVNDFLTSAIINFGGSNKATVVIGYTLDGNSGSLIVLLELGANVNGGGFASFPYSFGSEQAAVGGTSVVYAASSTPITFGAKGVTSIVIDKSLASGAAKIRVNGGIFDGSSAATVGGTLPNAVLNIGSRNGAANYAQAKISSVIVISTAVTPSELIALESYSIASQKLPYSSTNLIGVGDSHTYNTAYGQTMQDFYPARLDTALRPGWRKSSVNYGVSGDTTSKIIARLSSIKATDDGKMAIIYAGTNDVNNATTVQASPTPTTTTFSIATGYGNAYKAGGFVLLNGVSVAVSSVVGDAITLAVPLAVPPTAGDTVASDIRTNIVLIGNALKARGYTKLLIGGQHYLNFATGGDTLTTPVASLVALRVLQAGAAADLGATFVDFYAAMRALIVAGTYAQGNDLAWHVAAGNTHLNNIGQQILSDAIYAAMQSKGWT